MNKKTAAIIMASGFGGRFLPISKSINKCMMPVLNKPVLQYRVEECLLAGVDQIYITVPTWDTQVSSYFTHDDQLEERLAKSNKTHLYHEHVAPLESISAKVEVVKVPHVEKVGTAVPPRYVIEQADSDIEQFIIMNGDDMIARKHGIIGELAVALSNHPEPGAPLLLGFEVSLEQRHRYGVLIQHSRNPRQVARILEKPEAHVSPESLLANHGCYLLPKTIVNYIDQIKPNPTSGEYYITDAINLLLQETTGYLHRVEGEFLDFGQPDSWLRANNYVAKLLQEQD